MVLTAVLQILILIWVCLVAVILAVNLYRGLVWLFKKLNEFCDTWEEWVYALALIDVVLMLLVGFLMILFN